MNRTPLTPSNGSTDLSIDDGSDAQEAAAPKLSLTDFLDLDTLQEIQDSFTAVTRLVTTIRDADDQPITRQTDAESREKSDEMLEQLLVAEADEQGRFIAPILVEGQQLGSLSIEPQPIAREATPKLLSLIKHLGVEDDRINDLIRQAEASCGPNRASSVQFLYLLANSIARLCYDEYQTRQRVDELSALYRVSTVLSAHQDLQQVLDTAAQTIAEVMDGKAAMIRLIEKHEGHKVFAVRAAYNLSQDYISKVHIPVNRDTMFHAAIHGDIVEIEEIATDERALDPQGAKREGLASMLCAGMIYQGEPIGVLQLFTGKKRAFSRFEVHLLLAIAQILASAIENARLEGHRYEHKRMSRQLHLAANVQRQMLPREMPNCPPFDIAAKYVPSFELGGDFYDFIELEDNHLGIAIGDVVGKGVAASLLMASTRASLRACAQDIYDIDEIISRVNVALSRDTLDNEFATVWYGVFDPEKLRLTYCNAGHDPPLVLHRGKLFPLDVGGMIVGVDDEQHYEKGMWDFIPGDVLLLYTDGLPDSFNAQGEKFGRPRIEQALKECADKSAHDTLNHLLWSVRTFTGMHRAIDDTSLVIVRVGEH